VRKAKKVSAKHAAPRKSRLEAEKIPPDGDVARETPAPQGSAATAGATLLDRRAGKDRRSGAYRRQKDTPVPVERRQLQRRAKVNRRRQIDPTTCERDYTPEEIDFMNAMDQYKRTSGRMFPTCSEVLEVLKKLGYERRPQPAPEQPGSAGAAAAAVAAPPEVLAPAADPVIVPPTAAAADAAP